MRCGQEAKETQFDRALANAVPPDEQERLNRRTAWEDVTHAFGMCAAHPPSPRPCSCPHVPPAALAR